MPEYALILLLLLICTVYLHRRYHLKLFQSPQHLIISYAIILSFGILWDQYAISKGHWSFNQQYLLGPRIGFMPVEEYAFGIILPYFGLVIYHLVGRKTHI